MNSFRIIVAIITMLCKHLRSVMTLTPESRVQVFIAVTISYTQARVDILVLRTTHYPSLRRLFGDCSTWDVANYELD